MDNGTTTVMLALVGLVLVNEAIWRREVHKLLDRIMAGDMKTYKYYEKKYDNDVRAVEAVRDFDKKKLSMAAETLKKEQEEAKATALADDDAWDYEEDKLYAQPPGRGGEQPGKSISKEEE